VLTDFSIGRGESCNLRFPEVLSVSRSHCLIELRDREGGGTRLVAYDDGSLVGTQLRATPLGVGREHAQDIEEGDTLRLGSDVTVRLQAVSDVLNLDDHDGLAEFFERVGERRTAQSLREEPRLTEKIVSSFLTAGNIQSSSREGGFNFFDSDARDDFEL